MLARAVSTAFATPAAAPNTASPPGSARSRPGSARHVASPTRSDRPLPGPHAQVDGRSAAHMPSQPRSAALRQPVARQRPSVAPIRARSTHDRPSWPVVPPSNLAQSRPAARRRPGMPPVSRLRRPLRDPRHPYPGPPLSYRQAGGRARTHVAARAAWNFQKENQRAGPVPRASLDFHVLVESHSYTLNR